MSVGAASSDTQSVLERLDTGDVLRVDVIATNILRVRLSADGEFGQSLMERYGIVRTNWPGCEFSTREEAGVKQIRTSAGTLEINRSNGAMRLLDASEKVLCDQVVPQATHVAGATLAAFKKRQSWLENYFKGEKRKQGQVQIIGSPTQSNEEFSESMHEFYLPTNSFGASFQIRDDERFYGLGTTSARRLELRGHAYRLWTQYRRNFGFKAEDADWEQTEGPIPFLSSTGGWGIFVNTTWAHYYDIGRYEKDKMFFWGPGGQLDFYFLISDSLPRLIELYTEITGKPRLMPEFGYGLTYVSQITENEHEVLTDSRLFRDRDIPCDIIGLEPQWMKKFYDASRDKTWSDKFYVPAWMGQDSKRLTFIGGLDRTGFKLSLWLVCDDDLTIEAEREVAEQDGKGNEFPAEPEAWFEHLKKFVRNGARCFKMDPGHLIEEHPHREYFNGRSDLENHNLTQILYHKQMCEGYEQFTHKRAMTHYCAGYAGVQHWGATTMGDNGGGPSALAWMLSYSMSGHMNTTCDMDVLSPQGMHFGFLEPWAQLNSWAYTKQPWFLGKDGEAMFRDYARLRYRLMPYIYSAAYVGHLTGMPILRAMPLMYPDDRKVANSITEYMLGDSLLVAAFTDTVYLPAGHWIDYWTGKEYDGPLETPCVYPRNRAGGLFIKAGAIIPYWPDMDFVGDKPVETLTLEVYPKGKSDYTLYEDDGDSLEYLNGTFATTRFHCEAGAKGVTLTIEPRQGDYKNMAPKRNYKVRIHTTRPQKLTVNGARADSTYDEQDKVLHVEVAEDVQRNTPVVISCQP